MVLIVERDIPDLGADGIDETARQAEDEIAGQEEIFMCFSPNFWLMRGNPVGFRLCLKIGDRVRIA